MNSLATDNTAAAAAKQDYEVKPVLVVDIRESKTNQRRSYDNEKLGELAESIKRKGIISPLVLREKLEGRDAYLEVVAGHRRLRAAKLAGLVSVPAIILDLTDAEALEVQVIENLQRVDLHPLEEAIGYIELIEKHNYTVDDLAAKVHKHKSYVYGRMRLGRLPEQIKKALWEEKITPGIAEVIARIHDPKTQLEIAKDIVQDMQWGRSVTVKSATEIVSRYVQKLDKKRFDTSCPNLLPAAGPCSACPKRTGAGADLFPDIKSGDVCLDPTCFRQKLDAAWDRIKAANVAAGTVVIDGKTADNVISDGESYCSGKLLRLDADKYDDKARKHRKISTMLGQNHGLKVTLVRGSDGQVHEMVNRAEAYSRLRENGAIAESRAQSPREKSPEQKRKERDKATADRLAEEARIAALVSGIEARTVVTLSNDTTTLGNKLLLAIVHLFKSKAGNIWTEQLQRMAKARGLDKAGLKGDFRSALEKLEKELRNTPEKMLAFTVECAIRTGDGYWAGGTKQGSHSEALAAALGIDLKAIERKTREEFAAQVRERQQAKKSKDKNPAAKKSAPTPSASAKKAKPTKAKSDGANQKFPYICKACGDTYAKIADAEKCCAGKSAPATAASASPAI